MVYTRSFFNTLLGTVYFSLLQQGDSLKCFNCDSIMNKDCANLNMDSDEYLVDCTSTEKLGLKRENPVCYQAHGKVNLMIVDGGAVVRGCGEKPVYDESCSNYQLPGFNFVSLNCSTCSEDRCNGQYVATAAPALIVPTFGPTRTPKDSTGGAYATTSMAGIFVLSLWSVLLNV